MPAFLIPAANLFWDSLTSLEPQGWLDTLAGLAILPAKLLLVNRIYTTIRLNSQVLGQFKGKMILHNAKQRPPLKFILAQRLYIGLFDASSISSLSAH